MSGRKRDFNWGEKHVWNEVVMMDADIERFFEKVSKEESGCWRWTGCLNPPPTMPYGRFRMKDGSHYAHRISFLIHKGEIPPGMQVDHLCRHPWCVNPDHLEPVTPRENSMRGNSPTILIKRRGYCKRGHEINAQNTAYDRKNGSAHCRICRNQASRQKRRSRGLKYRKADA